MLRKKVSAVVLIFIFLSSVVNSQVRTGLDNLAAKKYSQLKGKKIGLICNQTSRTFDDKFAPKLFEKENSFKLVALFSPEHGLLGKRKAGVKSDTSVMLDSIPVYSLYGTTRKPTKAMLKGITTLVFDIQDIGVRPYTYLSTMIYAMEAAAENKIEFIVLDRPNPLSGDRIEGNILDTSLRSFVGLVPVPYVHGMTLGELAKMAKGEKWFKGSAKLKLTVIEMSGWKRSMYWNETGLKWVAPSPNIPTFESAVGCAMFGAVGELGILSIGIGSREPFMRVGSKLVKPEILEAAVLSSLPKGISAKREDYSVPFGDSTKTFYGMRFIFPKDLSKAGDLYGAEYRIMGKLLKDSVFLKSYKALPFTEKRMFEKVTGTKTLLTYLDNSRSLDPLFFSWKKDTEKFRTHRKKYLLYK